MDLNALLEDFFATRDYSPYTVLHYRRWIEKAYQEHPEIFVAADADIWNTPGIKQAFRDWIQELPYADSQKKQLFYALRAFLKWAYGERHPLLSLQMKFPVPPPPVREVNESAVVRLLQTFDRETPRGKRDWALALLWIDTGLRVGEMARVTLSSLYLDKRELHVLAKGRRWRRAVFSQETALALQDWLTIRQSIARPGVDAVFVSLGTFRGKGLTRNGLRVIVRKWGKSIGIHMSPHDFRRLFATLATRSGAPERIVAEAGGWRSTEMIRRYTSALKPEDIEPYSPARRVLRQLDGNK